MARELNIRITADNSQANAALAQTEKGLQGVEKTATTAGKSVGSLGEFAKGMAVGFVGAAVSLETFELAARKAAEFVSDSVKQYLEAEQIQRKMVAALEAQGRAIPVVIEHYEALSRKYEDLTVNSDEAIKSSITLLTTVGGVLPGQMDDALKAVTNLAAGLGIDLKTATTAVARGFEDNYMSLHRLVPEIDTTRAAAEGMDYVLGVINSRFNGAALADAASYTGQIQRLANQFDDLKESIGRTFVESGAMHGVIVLLQIAITELNEDLKQVIGDLAILAKIASFVDTTGLAGKVSDSLMLNLAAMSSNPKTAAPGDLPHVYRDATDDAATAALAKHLEAVQKLREEYQKWEREMLTGVTDAERKQYDFAIKFHDKWGAWVGIMQLHVKVMKELDEATLKYGAHAANIAPPPFLVPVAGNPGDLPIPGARPLFPDPRSYAQFREPPLDPHIAEQAGRYLNTLTHIADMTQALGGISNETFHAVYSGVMQMVGAVEQYEAAMISATTEAQAAAAASATAWAVATAGITLAITLSIIWHQKMQQQHEQLIAQQQAARQEMADIIAQLQAMGQDPTNLGLRALRDQLKEATERMETLKGKLDGLGNALTIFGGHAPAALRPFIDQLIAGGRMSKEMMDRLRGFATDPSWQDILEIAKKIGLSESALGAGYQQSRVNDLAKTYFAQYTQLTDIGADHDSTLRAFADEIQDLINTGASIPRFLKPMIDEMIGLGILNDRNGNQLADSLSLAFNDLRSPLEEAVDWLHQIYDLLRGPIKDGPQGPKDGSTAPLPGLPPGAHNGTLPPVGSSGAPPVSTHSTIVIEVDGKSFTKDVVVDNLPGVKRVKFGA